MSREKFVILHELLHKIASMNNCNDLKNVVSEYAQKLGIYDDELARCVVNDVRSIADKLVLCEKQSALASGVDKLSSFTDLERAELEETNRVIDGNLFDYHFQPIVSAVDGKIFSYEALMRPKSELCPSPFHILKYAEFTNRLDDIERATFMNILDIVDEKKEQLADRRVFINSIPATTLCEEDRIAINKLLEKNADKVVVEMTEQSELDEKDFLIIKDTYSRMNVKIAVDDYGTGYSNVKNLLEYMPNYVKIDRTLLHNINNDKKKRHFVREIIAFCHDNGILALAEGVETSEELRTVIRLGIDLVQGFYTARPVPEIIDKIPYEIRQEIILYHQELEAGKDMHVYVAENNERVKLDRLKKEDYKRVVIGKSGNGDVTLVGTQGVENEIYIDVSKGFSGKITIENIDLISDKNNPCITIGEGSDVVLEFVGQNHLRKSGIKVPESSKLVCCGEGNLYIYVDGLSYFGIGNDGDSKHGELVFEKGVAIENNSAAGVCIGSGRGGGKIRINNGKFDLRMTGNYGIGIGSFLSDVDIDMVACDMEIDLSVPIAVGIGSFDGQCFASIKNSYVAVSIMGVNAVGIGTLNGLYCKLDISEAKVILKIAGEHCTAVGAISGKTEFSLIKAGTTISAEGEKALAIGGFNKDTMIKLVYADTSIRLASGKVDYKDYYIRENVIIDGGRTRFVYNEQQITDL